MRVDEQTARDLEIFQAPAGGASLFDLLDRTRTVGGRDALRARFRNPLSDRGQICAVQQSIRFILGQRTAFDRLPSGADLAIVTRYLQSNLVPASALGGLAGVAETLWMFVFYRDLFRESSAGVAATRRILGAIDSFLSKPALEDAPGELGILLEEMAALNGSRELRALRGRSTALGRWLHVLRDDRAMRETSNARIDRLFHLLYQVDSLVSLADATNERGFELPDIAEERGIVEAQGLFHPCVTGAVTNDLTLGVSGRVLFLTGPNMAGKTTYLRACGIAVYLAHLGMGVPARRLRLGVFDALLTAIGLSDNVRMGISFFRAEALRMKDVARAVGAGEHVLGIFDEPFKGTNVRDALDASREVLLRLTRANGCAFLFASHLIELADALQGLPQVLARRFDAQEAGRELRYDYVVRPGVSDQRLGMRVLEEEGVFDLFDGRTPQPAAD